MSHLAHCVVLLESGEVIIREQMLPDVAAHEVLVQSLCSLLSSGTERIIVKRGFDHGSHWDEWIRYPFPLGYATIGRVIEVGTQVPTQLLGQTVALRVPHASHHAVRADTCIEIGERVPPKDAVWFALARIGFLAVSCARVIENAPVLVIGGGPIAQMVLRWLSLHGSAQITIMTTNPLQAESARIGGASAVLSQKTSTCSPRRLARDMGRRPSLIFDCTADPSVTEWALRALDDYGQLVVIGDTGQPRERRLTEDLVLRSLTITGTHDSCTFGKWTDSTVAAHFISNVHSGNFRLDGLVSHTFPAMNAPAAYSLLVGSRDAKGIILDWSNRGKFSAN